MTKCRSCGVLIEFVKTEKGRSMPVNATSFRGEQMYDPGRHEAHFATCPNAAEWRKRDGDGTNQAEENRKAVAILKITVARHTELIKELVGSLKPVALKINEIIEDVEELKKVTGLKSKITGPSQTKS